MSTRKLTMSLLRRIMQEEKQKMSFGKPKDPADVASDVDEVEPEDLADTLEKDLDHLKALKIGEGAYIRALRVLDEAKKKLKKKKDDKKKAEATAVESKSKAKPKAKPKAKSKKKVKMNEAQLRQALANVRKRKRAIIAKYTNND